MLSFPPISEARFLNIKNGIIFVPSCPRKIMSVSIDITDLNNFQVVNKEFC